MWIRNFVQVADWDIGTTESGSSGAALFDFNSKIIGHLSGGDAACGNDLYDDFGMFKKSWEGGRYTRDTTQGLVGPA